MNNNDTKREMEQIEEFKLLERGMLEASRITLDFWRKEDLKIEKEGSAHSIITEADPVVEEKIKNVIKDSYPQAKVWGEENARDFGPDSWGIDPIDGTNVFSIGGRDWCNAVVRMDNGEPVFSMIVVPLGFEGIDFYTAKKGQGAFLKEFLWTGGTRVRRLKTRDIEELAQGTLGMRQEDIGNSSRSGASEEERLTGARIQKLSVLMKGTLCPGSSSFVMASAAAGRLAVACSGPQAIWDAAMGDLLVSEAGGVVTQLNGEKIDYMKCGLGQKTSWLASGNSKIHEQALRVLI